MIETWNFASIVSSNSLSRDTVPGNYSAFKLGRTEDIALYAQSISNLLKDHLLATQDRHWLVTGPPLTAIPCAANLLAEEIVAQPTIAKGWSVTYRPLRKLSDVRNFPDGHYAKLPHDARRKVLEDASRDAWITDSAYVNANVIVVDDVRVTGSHERVMRSFLDKIGAERVHWQYVLDLRLAPGSRAEVEEPRLNSVAIGDRGVFALVAEDHFQPTTRFIWGLFASDQNRFAEVVEAMRPETAALIVELIRPGFSSDRFVRYWVSTGGAFVSA